MSIEKDLSRIADALERIASMTEMDKTPELKLTKAPAPVADDAIPGVEVEPETETVSTEMTPAELRELAQKYIQAAGDKTGALVNFIKDSVCKKLNPAEPKLVKIPAGKIAEAAKMIDDFCKKNGIVIPTDV